MKEKQRYSIPLKYKNQVKSLCWVSNYLIDFAGGYARFYLDGESEHASINYAYRFDAAISTPDGKYAVIYEKYGTKALVLKDEKIVREINRSFYCANSYEYPVAIFSRDETFYLAHCPDEYNIVEIEEIESGERITRAERESTDFFQSRLQLSPNRKWLLSAGWVWHPLDSIQLFDLSENMADPPMFDVCRDNGLGDVGLFEIHEAIFLDDENLLMSGETDDDSVSEDEDPRNAVVKFDFIKKEIVSKSYLSEPLGKLFPINNDFCLGFYGNPKLVDVKTGEIIYKWEDIDTDKNNSSILCVDDLSSIAFDHKNKRVAVALNETIEVLVF